VAENRLRRPKTGRAVRGSLGWMRVIAVPRYARAAGSASECPRHRLTGSRPGRNLLAPTVTQRHRHSIEEDAMGLFGKLLGNAPAKKATDDVLLLHAMMLMSSADGYMEGSEIATLEGFINTLPEFKDADFDKQMAEAKKLRAKFNSVPDAVKALADISSEAVRKKAFILAADIALSSGDVDEKEEELLEAMQRVMNIDDALANNVIEILAMKYAK
jgi:tellurite resistance protein